MNERRQLNTNLDILDIITMAGFFLQIEQMEKDAIEKAYLYSQFENVANKIYEINQ